MCTLHHERSNALYDTGTRPRELRAISLELDRRLGNDTVPSDLRIAGA